MNRSPHISTVLASLVCVVWAGVASIATAAGPAGLEFFERRIRPVLVERCYECHSAQAKTLRGGLRLDSRDGVRRGGDSGPAVVPGNADDSLLVMALRHEGLQMPPDQRLPDDVVRDFEEWVRLGAPDPRTSAAPTIEEPTQIDIEAGRKFWSFRPLAEALIPDVRDRSWPEGSIDRYVLAGLEARGLTPTDDAERPVLLRRVTFDLIGLPPTPEELAVFVGDNSPDAFDRVVDCLLASPHFGERWGRHWLDVARFAESSGGGRSMLFPEAWRYRDYVVQAFNENVPYDRFLTEQIAGDLLPHSSPDERAAHLTATGFLVLGPHNYEEQDKAALEMDVVDEQLDTLGRALLGLTLGCARCHDHKFDPIPARDYYALAGILRSTGWLVHENVSRWTERPLPVDVELERMLSEHDRQVASLEAHIAKLKETANAAGDGTSENAAKHSNPGDLKQLQQQLRQLSENAPYRPATMAVEEVPHIEDCAIRIRGNVHSPGGKVPRGFVQVATVGSMPHLPENESGRRELAAWLTNYRNPLTARVYVNRVWHHLFGAGLVRTVDNFGAAGEPPSHPELLDSLAGDLMRNGWSTKHLVRTIVLSRVYRMTFAPNPAAAAVDPENRLLWRANRKRLEAECLRDAMLAISGELDPRMGGKTIQALGRSNKSGEPSREYEYVFDDVRRSVYTPVLRNRLPELFEVFDFSDPNQPLGARAATTTASQALVLMNDPFVIERSRQAAGRLMSLVGLSDKERVELAYRTAISRLPTAREAKIVLETVQTEPGDEDADSAALCWERLYQALFASIEFRYVE